MTDYAHPPDPEPVLRGLKDFQRATVEYVFRRLYADDDAVRRFLIADEVGLGKTMVARGVVAKAVEHLWDKRKRIDIVYVCSNGDIARQNLNRLTLPGIESKPIPSRITLLPKTVKELDPKLNFISITPGTSFNLRSTGGTAEERALIYRLLEDPWEFRGKAPRKVFAGSCTFASFKERIGEAREAELEPKLCAAFVRAVKERPDLRQGFDRLCDEVRHHKHSEAGFSEDVWRRRRDLVGELRRLMAEKCLKALQPDVVILDEFQRFRHLISTEETEVSYLDEMRELAQKFMDHPHAVVLMLSATPYKMYTLPEEMDSDDHYADLKQTLGFLFEGGQQSGEVIDLLHDYGRQLLTLPETPVEDLAPIRDQLERKLLRVMVRTERLAASEDRNGMLCRGECTDLTLRPKDVLDYVALQRVADALDRSDMLEYWKSGPYLLNFMDDYKVKQQLKNACEVPGSSVELVDALTANAGLLLDWGTVREYGAIDPSNARLRSLLTAMLTDPLWRLLWTPPSLPYYRLGGPFAAAADAGFTKRLIFSSWAVVPKAIASLVSYEAERRIMRAFDGDAMNTPEARKRRTPLLRFAQERVFGGPESDARDGRSRLSGMNVLALVYPCASLAAEVDPLIIGGDRSADEVLADVVDKVESMLGCLPDSSAADEPVDERWYWAAPLLLDLDAHPDRTRDWWADDARIRPWTEAGEEAAEDDDDEAGQAAEGGAFAAHVEAMRSLLGPDGQRETALGRRPDDLTMATARLALAGPGVACLRSLSRVCGGRPALLDPDVRTAASQMAWALRNMFNLPESMAVVRALHEEEGVDLPYWRQVLRYSVQGCLQAVLDEYVHILRESEGLIDETPAQVARGVSKVVCEALSLRTSSLVADAPVADRKAQSLRLDKERLRARYALRFGDTQSETGKTIARGASVRVAFNSPFWPFVLATTSLGQEGLDFHCYCHAVMHWNLPSNPVDLEQREGRVHRYKGHAVRKNVARRFGLQVAAPTVAYIPAIADTSATGGSPAIADPSATGGTSATGHTSATDDRPAIADPSATGGTSLVRHIPPSADASRVEGSMDPWERLFAAAVEERRRASEGEHGTAGSTRTAMPLAAPDRPAVGDSDLVPFWIYPLDDGARIERYVPSLPLSRDAARYDALVRSLVVYRAAIGQPRQQDVVEFLLKKLPPDEAASIVEQLRIDLSPPDSP